jgi:hypothetical protein
MTIFETEIAIRAYTERPGCEPFGGLGSRTGLTASKWAVVFDCETSIEATQRLRVGFFQTREKSKLERAGIFFDPNAVTEPDERLIRAYAGAQGLEVLTIAEFRTDILLKYGYTRHATIVGFNLPFDISRVALDHGVARRGKRGGYSFLLTRNSAHPRIRVKHLSPKAAMIDFSKPGEQDTPHGERTRRLKVDTYRGHFVDIKTLASALLSRRFTLRSLAETLRTPTQKHKTDEHGKITEAYLDYARADVQVTWECYQELSRRYAEHGLSQAVSKILSEATIGKAYLQEMGIKPFLGCNPAFDRSHFGRILCAYYGGRAEVRNRRTVREVIYCDFKSMYPTVNGLMGLGDFVTSEGIEPTETTAETKAFLETVTQTDLQNRATWRRRLTTLVRMKPHANLLPVRAPYDERTYTIGLNRLTTGTFLWYTLADCIVSKLLTGKTPQIEEAITYRPGPRQEGLKPVKILGRDDCTIDPYNDDFYLSLVDLRDKAKAKGDPIEKTLKIIANSTSYGIFIEVNRDDAPKSELLNVYGPNGDCLEIHSKVIEEPGRFFNPLLSVLITGAARLMLGLAEKLTVDCGLDWAFCDTDSLAIVRPDRLSRVEFRRRAAEVIDWFVPLNPYKMAGSILQIEKINYRLDSETFEPLYCFAISAKRYALFNLDGKQLTLRKASAHGLGHLMEPYTDEGAPPELPKPRVPLGEIGVARWQHDFWLRILRAAVDGDPDHVSLDWHPSLSLPAAQRYSASSPHLLAWLDQYNARKAYDDQIRPFGFLLVFTARSGVLADYPDLESCVVYESTRGRPTKCGESKPIAPFDSDPACALAKVFDRVTGRPVQPQQLKTYADVLVQYHLSPEHKFANGDHLDRGRTERRHVVATGLVWIGKEANQVGESGEADPIWSAVEEFARSSAKSTQGARVRTARANRGRRTP